MFRKCALFLAGALALSSLAVAPAGASGRPNGTLICGVTGGAIIRPGLPPTTPPRPKASRVLAQQVEVSNCDASGVDNDKPPIKGGTLRFSARATGGACDTLTPPTITDVKIKGRLTGSTNPGPTLTVANVSAQDVTVDFHVDPAGPSVVLEMDGTIASRDFANQHFHAVLVMDRLEEYLGCAAGENPVTYFGFSAAGGSSFTIS